MDIKFYQIIEDNSNAICRTPDERTEGRISEFRQLIYNGRCTEEIIFYTGSEENIVQKG